MDSNTSIPDINTNTTNIGIQDGKFTAGWRDTDTDQLQPNNLPIARIRRAWERKPLSPLSRRKVRVGKVWKRAIVTTTISSSQLNADAGLEQAEGRGTKRIRARRSLEGFLKPVKKLCLDSDFGMGASVARWEVRDSPERKIVTRSKVEEEELVALSDDEENEDDISTEDVTIEILDEDGRVLEADVQDEGAGGEWLDVEDGDGNDGEESFDGTMMHLSEAIAYSTPPASQDVDVEAAPVASGHSTQGTSVCEAELTSEQAKSKSNQDHPQEPTEAAVNHESVPVHTRVALSSPAHAVPLPEGFVSPAKQRRKLGPRTSRTVAEARRRTLPVQFAPAVPVQEAPERETIVSAVDDMKQVTGEDTPSVQLASELVGTAEAVEDVKMAELRQDEAEDWEDLADAPDLGVEELSNEGAMITEELVGDDIADEGKEQASEDMNIPLAQTQVEPSNADNELRADDDFEPSDTRFTVVDSRLEINERLPSSPVPTIEGPHPRLPLRRSPRRKSSSPLKLSAGLLQSMEKPHLVAFSPLKVLSSGLSEAVAEDADTHFGQAQDVDMSPSIPLPRASSAPPEEPQMSPRKPAKPRVSDDTALLLNFLNRAAESKSSRSDISAAKQEGIANRRDSDTIRQALASPASVSAKAAVVLMDLDPNSPSPRKQSATAEIDFGKASHGREAEMDVDFGVSMTGDADPIEEAEPVAKPTRRSGRGRRAPQTLAQTTYSAPSKITIRGPASAVDIAKKTEAQQLAKLTSDNTKKNKLDAMRPVLRLMYLAAGQNEPEESLSADVDPAETEVLEKGGKRRVAWAETLVSFYAGKDETEGSQLSDGSEEQRMPWERPSLPSPEKDEKKDEAAIAIAPAPADTPSKPKAKIRRLKLARTAAAPSALPTASQTVAEVVDQPTSEPAAPEAQSKPAPKPRRSRIATPAKGLTNASLLPADLAPVLPPTDTKPAPKKKLASKLPAPSSVLTTAHATNTSGKENLIASPPKKRTNASIGAVPTAKTFAPKLDFGKGAKLAVSEVESLPGLASPAKKGRKAAVFSHTEAAMGPGHAREQAATQLLPGLASPAKKRTRRNVQ